VLESATLTLQEIKFVTGNNTCGIIDTCIDDEQIAYDLLKSAKYPNVETARELELILADRFELITETISLTEKVELTVVIAVDKVHVVLFPFTTVLEQVELLLTFNIVLS
jgi:hypothetical protein